jgi:hypothetical protein
MYVYSGTNATLNVWFKYKNSGIDSSSQILLWSLKQTDTNEWKEGRLSYDVSSFSKHQIIFEGIKVRNINRLLC